jgi:two-component system cell cycle sensor histidine kinase/response regulator CckA
MTPDQERDIGPCLFREVHDSLLLVNPANLLIVDANPAAQRLTGRPGKALVGVPFPDLFLDTDPAILARLVQACQSTAYQTGAEDLVLRASEREPRRVQVHVGRIHPESGTLGLVVMRDVTRQRRAEQALRESEARFRSLAEHVRVVPWEAAGEVGRFTYVGPQAEALFGYPVAEWSRPNFWADHIHPADHARALLAHAEAAGRRDDYDLEYRFRAADGRAVWVHDIVHVVHDADGGRRLQGFLFDLTAQKRLEEQLRQAHKLEAVGRLASGIARDFNNLLTAILGCSDLVRERLPPNDDGRELLGHINDAAARAADLVRQLLAFGQRQMFRPRVLNLNEVVRQALPALQHLLGPTVGVSLALAPTAPRVRADAAQLEQVLLSLAANARDAMPEGGRLTLETAETILTEREVAGQNLRGRCAVLRVSDTGRGMDETTLGRLFEPYFTTRELGKGSGLGLATVYGIVKQSGGHVVAASEPGNGSRFTIYLPAVSEPASMPPPVAGSTSVRGTETVLVAEDEAAVLLLLRTVLEERGYNVLTARDGAEALEAFEQHAGPLHLLLTDISMPRMDGIALAGEVLRRRPQTRVLLISGYAPESLARALPHASFLAKPFAPRELLARVRAVLDEGRTPRGGRAD